MRQTLVLTALLCCVSAEASARPGNLERFPVGANRAGSGGAGVASRGSVWFNPAGIGRATTKGISASLSAYGYTVEKSPQFVLWDFGDGTSIEGDLKTSSVDLFPATLEYVQPLGELASLKHALGISVVVPDFDQFDGALIVPATQLLLELRARRISKSQTFWILPAWGACANERICFGAGPAVAVHQANDVSITTVFIEAIDGETADASESLQFELLTAAVGAYAGAQLQLAENLWIGITLRTPVAKVYGSGAELNVLTAIDSRSGEAYVDRVEVSDPKIEYTTPWRLALGIAYEKPGEYEFAADVRFMTGQSKVSLVRGPNGEIALPPSFPGGQIDDPERALVVERAFELRPTINANVGGRFHLSEELAAQVGLFTDLSGTSDSDVLANGNDQLSRIGVTLGGGFLTKETETWATAIYAFGFGSTLGFGENFQEELAPLRAHTVMLMLGSRADL